MATQRTACPRLNPHYPVHRQGRPPIAGVTGQYGQHEKDFFDKFIPKVQRGEIKCNYHVVRSLDEALQLVEDVQMGQVRGKGVIVLAEN